MATLAFLQNIGPIEGFALLALGLLLFGKRLPEVGRGLGKGIVE
ncbi:MAG: twin-arginine translocase TatA/TatE family subunit, partial [Pyrinomonadaceae bacterium]|nr:twin-arginine translocase TatA/TatE family subunit [Phycisphaerales bacterium]